MFLEFVKHATENIVASYAVLGSGRLFLQIQMFPESIKYATGNIVASYAGPRNDLKYAARNIVGVTIA